MPRSSECPSISSGSAGPCLLCGRCLEVCPVFRATCREDLSPRGKAFLLEQTRPMDLDELSVSRLAELCAGCGRCTRVCPLNIDLPGEIARLKSRHDRFRAWIWSRLVEAGLSLPPALRSLRHCLPPHASFMKTAMSPEPDILPVLSLTSSLPRLETPATVFSGCVGSQIRPKLDQKAGQLLNLAGFLIQDHPGWHCCGYPFRSAGLPELQIRDLRANLQIWLDSGQPLIFCLCAACSSVLKNLPEFLPGNPRARDMADSVLPLSSALNGLEACLINTGSSGQVVWHEPCHGPWDLSSDLEALLTRAGLPPMKRNRECCGMGGILALQHPGLSSSIARHLWNSMPQSPGLTLVTDCGGCLLQLQSTAPGHTAAGHWLDLLEIPEICS
ncbi:MAG: (Fe-S)-binding protein [Desulfonatronovibrionaceae bacterium]